MKVLSLFDGMSCGMLAMKSLGIDVDRYVAYEIDKYAVQNSTFNFPMIEQKGDVFKADFTEYKDFDYLVGGSPCTYWSIAQTKNRETVASGMGWELFSQYVRALHEAQPKYFLYENNKSMSDAIRNSITETFGFEPICINSALVSAQNRHRLYWCGVRQEDGTYKRADVVQPEDRGVLLKNILDKDFSHYKHFTEKEMDYMVRDHQEQRWSFCNRPSQDDKSKCLVANVHKGVPYNILAQMVEKGNYDFPTYEVINGMLSLKGKQYPIKLQDGTYIIRKMTLEECMSLQTVPSDYKWSVSNSQAYKMLGNGWTIQVIAHLMKCTLGI